MVVHVVLRLTGRTNEKGRPAWFSKELALASLLQAADSARRAGVPTRVHVIVDSAGPEPAGTIASLLARADVVERRDGGSARRSWAALLDRLEQQLPAWAPDDVVYLVEDDHVHTEDALTALVTGTADYRLLYCRPQEHDLSGRGAPYAGWRPVDGGVSSFATTAGTLWQDLPVLRRWSWGAGAWDELTWRVLGADARPPAGYRRWAVSSRSIYRGRQLHWGVWHAAARTLAVAAASRREPRTIEALFPNPVTHAEAGHLAEGVDWPVEAARVAAAEGLPVPVEEPSTRAPVRRPRVLVTLADRPWPVDSGKRRRASTALRGIVASGASVDVLVLGGADSRGPLLPPDVDVERATLVDLGLRSRAGGLLATAVRGVPWQTGVLRWGRAREVLRGWSRGRSYDLVWYGSLDHALSLRAAVHADRVVIDLDDVETAKARSFLALPPELSGAGRAKRVQRRLELPLWERAQRRGLALADAVLVCSELDRQRLGGHRHVHVVPNGYPAQDRADASGSVTDRSSVLLVGTYSYAPNADAAVVAATQVLPRLRDLVPDAELRVVGRGTGLLPPSVAAAPGVVVVGAVDDVAPELARAAVALAPVRFGGGTRVKVLEAFAHAVPVVSTTLGCEGLDARDGEHLLIGDDPEALAAACARLLHDPLLATRLGAAGRRLLEERFRPQDVEASVAALMKRLLAAPADR